MRKNAINNDVPDRHFNQIDLLVDASAKGRLKVNGQLPEQVIRNVETIDRSSSNIGSYSTQFNTITTDLNF